MMDLILLIGLPIIVAVGFLVWKLGSGRGDDSQQRAPVRRREDARDWQRRFGAESLLATNFFPPTQNEILETLYVLDHLMPDWETGEADPVERCFLNELALNFPTLRKASCAFPLSPVDTPNDTEIATRRETFRARRAQFNALDQIISGPATPGETGPASTPSERSGGAPTRSASQLWPVLLGSAAVIVAAGLVGMRFFPTAVNFKTAGQPFVEPSLTVAPLADEPATAPASAASEPVAESAPTPPPAPAAKVADATLAPPPQVTPSEEALTLKRQIAASKQRAVVKYPALAVEGSEINLRFVFRYKNLVQQNSPRLLDPNWPEELVEECAAAAGVAPKRDGFTRVLGTPR